MLTKKHLALIRAALMFFDEENSPHGPRVIGQYVTEPLDEEPTAADVAELRSLMQGCRLRYVGCDAAGTRLLDDTLHISPDAVTPTLLDSNDRVVSVLCFDISP